MGVQLKPETHQVGTKSSWCLGRTKEEGVGASWDLSGLVPPNCRGLREVREEASKAKQQAETSYVKQSSPVSVKPPEAVYGG